MEIYAAFVAYRKRNGLKELLFLQPHDGYYMTLPGAVQQLGEQVEDALQRGLDNFALAAHDIAHIGIVSGHTPDGRVQITHLFSGELVDHPYPQAARTSYEWMDKTRARLHHALMPASMLGTTLPYLEDQGHW